MATKPTITIYRGTSDKGQHVWSPFVVKLEARLRFANAPYTTAAGSPPSGPKSKVPYIDYNHSDAAVEKLGDSALIIHRLVEDGVLLDLNEDLGARDKAEDLAMRALIEDKLYFIQLHERWIQHYYVMREHSLSDFPWIARLFVGPMVYNGMSSALKGQGTGRHTDEEINFMRHEIWDAVGSRLAEARSASPNGKEEPFWYLGGSKPTEVDAVLFGFIASILACRAGSMSKQIVTGRHELFDYVTRIHDRYFPDYEKLV